MDCYTVVLRVRKQTPGIVKVKFKQRRLIFLLLHESTIIKLQDLIFT